MKLKDCILTPCLEYCKYCYLSTVLTVYILRSVRVHLAGTGNNYHNFLITRSNSKFESP